MKQQDIADGKTRGIWEHFIEQAPIEGVSFYPSNTRGSQTGERRDAFQAVVIKRPPAPIWYNQPVVRRDLLYLHENAICRGRLSIGEPHPRKYTYFPLDFGFVSTDRSFTACFSTHAEINCRLILKINVDRLIGRDRRELTTRWTHVKRVCKV